MKISLSNGQIIQNLISVIQRGTNIYIFESGSTSNHVTREPCQSRKFSVENGRSAEFRKIKSTNLH